MLFPTIDGQQQIGDETTKYLKHETIFATGNQVVNFKMPLPLGKEGYVSQRNIDFSHFPASPLASFFSSSSTAGAFFIRFSTTLICSAGGIFSEI